MGGGQRRWDPTGTEMALVEQFMFHYVRKGDPERWSQVALLIREIAGCCDPNGWDPSPAELVKFN